MATGLEMFDALQAATKNRDKGSEFAINRFDAEDLYKLTAEDLQQRGVDEQAAKRISQQMTASGGVDALGKHLGIQLVIERWAKNLIPGEGLRRTAGALKDDPETLEEMFEFLDELRHPKRAS